MKIRCRATDENRKKKRKKDETARARQLARAAALSVGTDASCCENDDGYAKTVSRLATFGDGQVRIAPSLIEGAGLGLFAARAFAKGEPITEYVGLIIPHAEARCLRQQGRASHVVRHVTLRYEIDGLRLPDGTPIVDARQQMLWRGVAALINHASGSRSNATFDFVDSEHNCKQMELFVRGVRGAHVDPARRTTFARASKRIEKGQEILVNYGSDYWRYAAVAPNSVQ